MSQTIVLDASAVIAFLQGEPGGEQVEQALQSERCVVTAANQAEIIAKSLDRGVDAQSIQAILAGLAYTAIDVLAEDGLQAGFLRALTRNAGLSLGDRLCLTVAKRLQAPVLTADRPWLAMATTLGIDIRCIRPDTH
jgi:ribonuclease VapC